MQQVPLTHTGYIDTYKDIDTYRWLEDPNCDETSHFVKDQNAITVSYLAGCEARDKYHAR